jgi:hypothetical protein|tara:strand:+ start:2196 stop:2483 length:288 start_codon:yes stop_codon:yes gene_type:complete
MLGQLNSNIELIQNRLIELKLISRTKNKIGHNKMIDINQKLKDILIQLGKETGDTLFENVQLVVGLLTALYIKVETLEKAAVVLRKCRKEVYAYS